MMMTTSHYYTVVVVKKYLNSNYHLVMLNVENVAFCIFNFTNEHVL